MPAFWLSRVSLITEFPKTKQTLLSHFACNESRQHLISPHINIISKHIAKENKQKTPINHARIVLRYMYTANFSVQTLKIPTTEESRHLGTLVLKGLSTLQFYCDSMETTEI